MKQMQEFRNVREIHASRFWLDRRGGVSAVATDRTNGLTFSELRRIFCQARTAGLVITSKRPLIVYGTCCPIGESSTFRFVQMTPNEIDALDSAISGAVAA